MLHQPLTNFKIQTHYQNEAQICSKNKLKFNGVYSRNNFTKIKVGAYVTNLDYFKSIAIHWIALYVNNNNVTYFDSFGVEHIPKEIKKFIKNKKYNNTYL